MSSKDDSNWPDDILDSILVYARRNREKLYFWESILLHLGANVLPGIANTYVLQPFLKMK